MKPILYHYWRSSSSWRVRWALAIKGIAFDSSPVNLLESEQTSEAHRSRNPVGHVPTLVMDGRSLSESVAILEYLEETHPTPALYPSDPWLRARTRQLVELINSGVQPLQNLIVLRKHSSEPEAQKEWARFFNERALRAYEALVRVIDQEAGGAGHFSIGDSLTAAELFLIPQIYSARRFGADLTGLDRIVAIERAAMATEHAAGAVPEVQPGAPVGPR